MSRLQNAILTGPFSAGYASPQLNLTLGGMNGYRADLSQFTNNSAYVQRPLVWLLLEAPVGFKYLPDPDYMTAALKALIELHPKTVTGFSRGLKADFVENAVGGGGEMQYDITDMKREQTQIQATYIDKYNRPIQNFWEYYMEMLMLDPESKVPGISTLPGAKPTDLLPDMLTFSTLAFEPDPTFQYVLKAWVTTGIMPKVTGDITGKRDIQNAMESGELSLDFTGTSASGLGPQLFAQSVLDSFNLSNANPNLAPSYISAIDADVAAQNVGFVNNVQTLAQTAVTQAA
jgi:hypothetical protein